MRLLVAGRHGQLGRALAEAASGDPALQATCLGRPELDIRDEAAIRSAFDAHRPDIAINAAAYTAVDAAETDPEAAFATNETGAGNFAAAAAEKGIPVVHISTDYVFSGENDRPWRETDTPSPINVYGRSKLAGELAVAATNPRHVIVRTAWVHSPWGGNFVKTMLRLGAERDELSIVADQTGTPSLATDLAGGILAVAKELASNEASPRGVHHLTNSGMTTWYGLAEEIFRTAANHGYRRPRLRQITTADYPAPAQRPRFSALDNHRIGAAFGVHLRDWREATADCVQRLLTIEK
ncbi:MAG: dTDP-4-dehydrorhamnose reductase [Nitratireductor sp.]|nr:dTDP-4-dehydrorhamnose reductase [Nitratireductor sp.]